MVRRARGKAAGSSGSAGKTAAGLPQKVYLAICADT